MRYFIIYFLAINIVTMVIYGIDKYKAKSGYWRISELTLIMLATIGGSIGALGGMYIFRHKTQHKKFTIGVPLILLAQVAIIILLMRR